MYDSTCWLIPDVDVNTRTETAPATERRFESYISEAHAGPSLDSESFYRDVELVDHLIFRLSLVVAILVLSWRINVQRSTMSAD